MFSQLMSSRRFAPLFWSQLLAALNDNLLKNALAMLVIYRLAMENGPAIGTLAGAALILPFFLFSALAGQYADKFDKADVAARVRLIEIPVALLAAAGFLLPSLPMLFTALILFGTLSAFFGPVKYGLLPSQLETRQLPAGNALIEGATFIAILLGTIGGNLASGSELELRLVAGGIVVISVLGWLAARMIPPAPSSVPDLAIDKNIVTSTSNAAQGFALRQTHLAGRSHHILVLAGRRRRAGAAAEPHPARAERHTRGLHPGAFHLRRRCRARIDRRGARQQEPPQSGACADRRLTHGTLSARPRVVVFDPYASPSLRPDLPKCSPRSTAFTC